MTLTTNVPLKLPVSTAAALTRLALRVGSVAAGLPQDRPMACRPDAWQRRNGEW